MKPGIEPRKEEENEDRAGGGGGGGRMREAARRRMRRQMRRRRRRTWRDMYMKYVLFSDSATVAFFEFPPRTPLNFQN